MEDPERERIAMNGDAERSGSPYSSFEVNGGLNGRDDDKHPINVSPGRERERELDVDADLELIEGEFNDVIHVHVPEVHPWCTPASIPVPLCSIQVHPCSPAAEVPIRRQRFQ